MAGDWGHRRMLSSPDSGEFANETKFLTNTCNLQRIKVISGLDITCLGVMTHGLQDVALLRRSSPYDGFWSPVYRALILAGTTAPDAVLQRVADAGKAADDCTVAVCVKQDCKGEQPCP